MPVCLQKGQKVSLTKEAPGLTKLVIGLGWDTNRYDTGSEYDLDAQVFMVGDNGLVTKQEDFIFFGNLKHPSGSVEHTGDNRTGAGDGDDEVIKIDLSMIPSTITRIVFTVTIYDAEERRQNFGQVSNAFVRLVDEVKNCEIARYDLEEDFSIETAAIFGELYKNGSDWKFNAIGSGYQGGLSAMCATYGIDVE